VEARKVTNTMFLTFMFLLLFMFVKMEVEGVDGYGVLALAPSAWYLPD
jgi:hypothetical protein